MSIRDYTDVLRRRCLFVLIPAILLAAATCAVALRLPSVYEARAEILVESQNIPANLASPTVTASAMERIQIIQQRLMSSENLVKIASKFGLYEERGARPSPTQIVALMRGATKIGEINISQSGGAIGFTVTFRYADARIASRVANEFVASILLQNIETRMARAAETSKFFEEQLASSQRGLHAIEKQIAAFKRENEDALPDTLPYRRLLLSKVTDEMAEIRRKLATYDGRTSGGATLRRLQHSLNVKELVLASREDERAALAPLAKKGFVPEARVREIDRTIALGKLEIGAIKAEIDDYDGAGETDESLRSRLVQLERQAGALQESILKTPEVEIGLNALIRNREVLQLQYQHAQARLAEAATGERLEEDQQAERFEVLERATIPEVPVSPKRAQIALVGAMGGVALGVALAVFLELLDTRIRTPANIERSLGLRPIVAIPYIVTAVERRRKLLRAWAVTLLILGLLAGALAIVHFYYWPLDILWERLDALREPLDHLWKQLDPLWKRLDLLWQKLELF